MQSAANLYRPKIVCIIGSSRFFRELREAVFHETINGNIVLSIGCNLSTDSDLLGHYNPDIIPYIRHSLKNIHLWKIKLCDEVLCLNCYGYIGDQTREELVFAVSHGKNIRYIFPKLLEDRSVKK